MAVAFIGRVGNDPFGTFNADDLQRRGVRTHLTRDAQHATGMVVVLVSADGERTMLTDRGASRHLRPEYLPAEAFQTGTHFHLSGYVLLDEPTRPAALHALRLAHDAGMRVSVDPVAATLIREAGAARFLEWTQGAELCMPNLEEARALVGDGTLEEVAARLAEHYGEVVVKLGANGAVRCQRGGRTVHAAAQHTDMVDTTGAGDAFCAGFLSARLRGKNPEAALHRGARAGARAVSVLGGRLP